MSVVPVEALRLAMQGDIDAVDDAFTEDVVFVDTTSGEQFDGIDEVREVWAEMAGRRAMAEVEVVDATDDTAALRYVIRFRADAHQYAQRGAAAAYLDAGRIRSWRSSWVEVDEDLGAWGDD
jgi:ketosteroid isomerase-like protein